MKWFQIEEQSAGEKRLVLTWYLYRCFGERMLYFIAFLVSVFTFIFSPKIRNYSKKYLKIISTVNHLKPSLCNQFKHIFSYACALADKIIVFTGKFNTDNIVFENEEDKKQLFYEINKRKGIFFICNHIGNIEVLQSLFFSNVTRPNFNINVFLSTTQSKIFNNFLNKIKEEIPLTIYSVKDIGLNTGIEIKEKLDKGEVLFIAGDRISENNNGKQLETTIFSKKIHLPTGTFKFAKLMEVPIYFISALKIKNKYYIYLEKTTEYNEYKIAEQYAKFLEKSILIAPFQFFHFYDFFEE